MFPGAPSPWTQVCKLFHELSETNEAFQTPLLPSVTSFAPGRIGLYIRRSTSRYVDYLVGMAMGSSIRLEVDDLKPRHSARVRPQTVCIISAYGQ